MREPLTLVSTVLEPAWVMVSFQHRLRDKLSTISFTRVVAANVPEHILGDSTRLLQVLSNLLSNSAKFTPEGGRITLTVDVQRLAPQGAAATEPPPEAWLRCCVQDTGVGLAAGACCCIVRRPRPGLTPSHARSTSADKLECIFQPFKQADDSTLRLFGGTGLGLAICRRIATAMGGSLTVQSEGLGLGATFEFVIPLLRTPSRSPSSAAVSSLAMQPVPVPVTPPSATPLSGTTTAALSPDAGSGTGPDAAPAPLRILIAEDDRLSQTLMRKLLAKMGFKATLVDNGGAVIETCCELVPGADGARCCFLCVLLRRARLTRECVRVVDPQSAHTTLCSWIAVRSRTGGSLACVLLHAC